MCVCVSDCRATCNDPVTVLKIYASKFLRGRALDIANEEEPCHGKTIEIFVSRQSLYNDAMSELVTTPPIQDVSYPLEVTFIGENAEDYGGPRKEFFGCAMRAIRDKLFFDTGNGEFKLTQDLTSLTENHYFGAGLIFGKKIFTSFPLSPLCPDATCLLFPNLKWTSISWTRVKYIST